MRLLALLRAAAVVVAVPSPLEPAAPSPCAGAGLLHTQCNTVANKVPAVTNALPEAGASVEAGLSAADKETFEHLLGHGFRQSPVVKWVSGEFAKRAVNVVLSGVNGDNDTAVEAELMSAFADPKFTRGNTGYVGPDAVKIKGVLEAAIHGGVTPKGKPGGNIREVWALMYALTKDSWANPFGIALQTATAAEISKLGLNASAVLARRAAIAATESAPKSFDKYSNGIGDWSYEGFESWVRFDFAADTLAGGPLWGKARDYATANACSGGPAGETPMMSNDPTIDPPLSADELAYQCNGTAPPCKLHWYPGALCFKVLDAEFAAGVPGYLKRATALGYRTVAAASGTTANVLQYGLMLGLKPEELVLLRLTMAAWMLCTNDHSLYEIMLGAAPYMPAAAQIVQGLDDLGRMMPADVTASDGTVFKAADVWASVAAQFKGSEGQAVLAKLGPAQSAYVKKLLKL